MKLFFKLPCIFIAAPLLIALYSCSEEEIGKKNGSLSSLPPDTGGEHVAEHLLPEKNIYGHYIYLPGGYDSGSEYPLIVFLHGMGEIGNSQNNPDELSKVLRGGIPRLIEKKTWNPVFPALVASPQCHEGWWNAKKIHQYIEYIAAKYKVDMNRIYITGLSMGGYGVFDYVGVYGDSSYVAAAAPICGGGNVKQGKSYQNIPIWAFHGDADPTVSIDRSIEMIEAINKQNPMHKAKLTVYPNVGHDSWTMTYDGTGMGKESSDYDSFSEDLYSWMLKYTKE